jgi:hypothetical protein
MPVAQNPAIVIKQDLKQPMPRNSSGMVFDGHKKRLLVFGGRQNTNVQGDLNDMWEYLISQKKWNPINYHENIEEPKLR